MEYIVYDGFEVIFIFLILSVLLSLCFLYKRIKIFVVIFCVVFYWLNLLLLLVSKNNNLFVVSFGVIVSLIGVENLCKMFGIGLDVMLVKVNVCLNLVNRYIVVVFVLFKVVLVLFLYLILLLSIIFLLFLLSKLIVMGMSCGSFLFVAFFILFVCGNVCVKVNVYVFVMVLYVFLVLSVGVFVWEY